MQNQYIHIPSNVNKKEIPGWSALVNTAFGFGVSYVSLGGIAILMNGTFLFALLSSQFISFFLFFKFFFV